MAGILMEALERLPSELTLLSSGSSDIGMLPPIMEDERAFFNDGGEINIKKENRGVFTAKAKAAGMGVQAYANKVMSAPEGRYPPALRKQANFARNAASWKNDGGYVYAANGADLSGVGGGPMGTDTVPAYLTENEFVIDADSAQQFGPVLEKINAWEPQMGSDEYFLNDIDNMINEVGGV